MITNSISGFSSIILTSLRHGVESIDQHEAEISKCDEEEIMAFRESSIITISSYKFKVLALLHVSKNPFTKAIFRSRTNDQNISDNQFYDMVGELSNVFSGKVKREVEQMYPYLGMSTPNLLTHQSFELLSKEDYQSKTHGKVRIDNHNILGASLLFSKSDDISLRFPKAKGDNSSLGELEFFE